jgi:hypothetical protein
VGIFGNQSLRLLRETWKTTNLLAEELYAILNSDGPFTIDGQVIINLPPGHPGPGIIINMGDSPGTSVVIHRPDGDTDLEDDDDGGGGGGGGGGGSATGVAIGTVQSGSGSTYIFELQGGGTATATVVGIDQSEELPEGTPGIIVTVGSNNFAYVALWN